MCGSVPARRCSSGRHSRPGWIAGRLALLGGLEAVAGDRVEPGQASVGAGALANADGAAGDESVLVELVEPVPDGLGFLAGQDGAADL